MPRGKAQEAVIERDVENLLVEFGSYSSNEDTASLAVKFNRGNLKLASAEKYLLKARLDVTLSHDPNDGADTDGQAKLIDTAVTVTGIADTGRLSLDTDAISFRLSFAKAEMTDQPLESLACKAGRLTCSRTGSAGGDAEGDETGDGGTD